MTFVFGIEMGKIKWANVYLLIEILSFLVVKGKKITLQSVSYFLVELSMVSGQFTIVELSCTVKSK